MTQQMDSRGLKMRPRLVHSNPFGAFDPARPGRIRGLFAANVLTEPVDIQAPVDLVWSIVVDF